LNQIAGTTDFQPLFVSNKEKTFISVLAKSMTIHLKVQLWSEVPVVLGGPFHSQRQTVITEKHYYVDFDDYSSSTESNLLLNECPPNQPCTQLDKRVSLTFFLDW
jgi:hypothetical protein